MLPLQVQGVAVVHDTTGWNLTLSNTACSLAVLIGCSCSAPLASKFVVHVGEHTLYVANLNPILEHVQNSSSVCGDKSSA